MKFKDLKANDILHSLDTESMTYEKYTILDVSPPKLDPKVISGCVVDIKVENKVLVFNSEDSYGMNGNLFYSTDFDDILNKLKSINLSVQTKLNEMDGLRSRKKLCEKLLADLDPDIKERQKNDRRLSEVENKVDDLNNSLKEIKNYLEKIINK